MPVDDEDLLRIRERKAQQLTHLLQREEEKKNWPGEVIHVTDMDLKTTLERYENVLVDFWAPWCGPCKMIGPVLDQLAPEYQGRMVIAKLNVDENQMSASRFKVQGIPTMILFRSGKIAERITGALPGSSLKNIISKHIGSEQ